MQIIAYTSQGQRRVSTYALRHNAVLEGGLILESLWSFYRFVLGCPALGRELQSYGISFERMGALH